MNLKMFNSLTGEKEEFTPLVEGRVGMYVCGPTVYSDVHLGNCRTFVNFDLIYRFLLHLGYKVRYVRNITDVGHLEGDIDIGGEDKIAKKARLEQLEPMEIVQRYTNGFHDVMRTLNALNPSIEPRATGHIMEQIEMVKDIIDNGYGYVENGSVYFDTPKFIAETGMYGKLSGRVVDDLLNASRDNLKSQDEKHHPSDFAIWIKADERHLMRWKSPWSVGFPGWHLECSVMSTKYLGETFDIHGGGNDLKFPHHENEIAQNVGACGCAPARYWLHANMLLMNGKKMSKSDGNHITPEQLFTGNSEHISQSYSPTVVRFFMLQAHYRSTLDLTDSALKAAEGGYQRLMDAFTTLCEIHGTGKDPNSDQEKEIREGMSAMEAEMADDFNAPKALARMFGLVTIINGIKNGQVSSDAVTEQTLRDLEQKFKTFLFDIFGLEQQSAEAGSDGVLDGVMQLVIDIRKDAREKKDFAIADKIRDQLGALEIQLKDGKDGKTDWSAN